MPRTNSGGRGRGGRRRRSGSPTTIALLVSVVVAGVAGFMCTRAPSRDQREHVASPSVSSDRIEMTDDEPRADENVDAHAAKPAPPAPEPSHLDVLRFADSESEEAHDLGAASSRTANTPPSPCWIVRAIDHRGNAPRETYGFEVDRRHVWTTDFRSDPGSDSFVAYYLNRETTIDRVSVIWPMADSRTVSFAIDVLAGTENWRTVFDGRTTPASAREFETYRFDPVGATAVRIRPVKSSGGPHTRYADIDEVRIGSLPPVVSVAQPGLGRPSRVLLPREPRSWRGGSLAFRMAVSPDEQTYFTVRFWGSDEVENRLMLFCEGKQIGYRHLGDIPGLDMGSGEQGCAGRFFYVTTPLPESMTRGHASLRFEIRASGRIWGYGGNWEQYQKVMKSPSRGIYAAYTHTDGCFVPPPDEKQGLISADAGPRTGPGPEVIDDIKSRLTREFAGLLRGDRLLNQPQMQFLARAWHIEWTDVHRSPRVVRRVVRSLDAIFAAYRADPEVAQSERSTYNPDWFGLGPAGYAVSLLAEPLEPLLDERIDDGAGGTIVRRAAYSEMLRASRDWHCRHRRLYTNQSMINDLYGIYLSNKGVAAVDPANARAEDDIRRYLYESLGMRPWLGNDSDAGPEKAVGDDYYLLTSKGLTKELGYVGYYGEVLDWVTQVYEATRPGVGQPGDERIRDQLVKIARARAPFRYPGLDADGRRAMRIEAIVGWRDDGHYPGDITYCQRSSWDGGPLEAAAATMDPTLVGYVQQMFDDNQFFASAQRSARAHGFRVTAGLLEVPTAYERLLSQPGRASRLPMSSGQPDHVFSDEEDGVVAIRHGDEILYVSLYWRARYGVNFLARVHYITPRMDRIATVRQECEYDDSGMVYTRPNWTNFCFGNGGIRYPGDLVSAHVGEKLPIAKIPAGLKFRPGNENVHAGKGSFYTLRYGAYLIAMNMTTDRAFELRMPDDFGPARDLVSGKRSDAGERVEVAPRSTVVMARGE